MPARGGRHGRRRRSADRNVPDQRGPARPRRQAADDRGGGKVLTQFLTAALRTSCTWSWRLSSWATRAQRFVGDGSFPWNPDRRAELAEVRRFGNVVLLRYALGPFRPGLKESTMHLPAATIVPRSCCRCGSLTDSARPRGSHLRRARRRRGISPSARPAAVSADPESARRGRDGGGGARVRGGGSTKAGRGHTRWTSRAMTCSTPRRRARTARRLRAVISAAPADPGGAR